MWRRNIPEQRRQAEHANQQDRLDPDVAQQFLPGVRRIRVRHQPIPIVSAYEQNDHRRAYLVHHHPAVRRFGEAARIAGERMVSRVRAAAPNRRTTG